MQDKWTMTRWGRIAPAGALIAVAALATQPQSAWADDTGAIKKITTVEGITEYELPNGLEVLLFPDPSKPTVTVNVTYRVGSRHEGRGETGMAHLLEHMVFKGTPTFPNIWGALEDHGASFNGTTWVDRTNYFETLAASDKNLEFALGMEADRMVNSNIAGEELAKEMTVVRNEFEMGENNPAGVLSERIMSAAFLWHNYGKSTIGNRSDIERVPVENLRRFYKKYYQPDNATLLVAGKFDTEKTLDLIQKLFGSIPRPDRTLEATYTEEPPQDGPRLVQLSRVGDVAAAGLVYHIPAGTHPDYPAVAVLEGVLTDQPSGRLYKALVEPGLATRISGSAFAWAEPGVLELSAQIRTEQDAGAVLNKMQDIVEGVAEANITDEEVERIKTQMINGIKLAMTDSRRIGIRLSESIAQGDWRMFFVHRDRIAKVTTADVQRAAKSFLLASNRTAGLFIPEPEPTRATIPMVPDMMQFVEGYTGSQETDAGEVFVATPENIDQRTRKITLPSGIRVALLSKENRGNSVQAGFSLRYGTEKDMTGHTDALGLISPLMMRGTKSKDHQQLRDAIDKLQSRISVGGFGRGGGGGGAGAEAASITSDRDNIVASIELLGEILKEPAFASDEFDTIVQQRVARMEEALSDPRSLGMLAMMRAMNPWPEDSIHYVPTMNEEIDRLKSVSLGSIKDLYERFYGAQNLDVAIVGDFDEKAVTDAIERVFGSWKKSTQYERVAKPHRDFPSKVETIDTPDKEMAVVGMGAAFAMRDDDPDYPALHVASYVLGQSAKSRLMNRLRHEGGLSYGAGGFLRADELDERAGLMANAICAPQNVPAAMTAMREEVTRWIADGITQEELAEASSSMALKLETTLANDRFIVRDLLSGFETGRTFAYHAKLMDAVKALTVDKVGEVVKRRLGKLPFVEMQAGDLSRKDAPPTSDEAAPPTDEHATADEPAGLPARLASFDANSDGKLQKSEAPERMQRFFDRMDANSDGAVDATEAAAMRGGAGGPGGRGGVGRMVGRLLDSDADKDGVIAKAEVSERMQGLFDRLDGNSDGKLDEKEIKEARERSQDDDNVY